MAKSKNRGHREARKPQREVPEVPPLGTLSRPRKTNRSAALYVANVGCLWDRRRADRKARRNALRRQEAITSNPRRQHLEKELRELMLITMADWRFDHRLKAFVVGDEAGGFSAGVAPERLEQLVHAVLGLGPRAVSLKVAGLSLEQAKQVRSHLAEGSVLTVLRTDLTGPPISLAAVAEDGKSFQESFSK